MLRRVNEYIRTHRLLNAHDKVLVCVSGGADSIALLDVLLRGGYECIVAHCNFHLRNKESLRDEQFVRDAVPVMATRIPVPQGTTPLYVRDFDTLSFAHTRGMSVETAARELRYTWFAELAAETGCKAIAVAHHQNDQAETVLMNMRRGAGLRGLCGMHPKSQSPVADKKTTGSEIPVIRPLLCTTHDYICHYLKDIRHLDWVEDSTNGDTRFRRNAIREELKTYSKAEIEHIAELAERMQRYMKHYGIIGNPLEHSWSMQYFSAFFRREHIAADFTAYPLPSLNARAELPDLDGFTVTTPYKQQIIPLLDGLDPIAATIGAVNVVKREITPAGQILTGYNTDCIGFSRSIRPLLKPTDRNALILGTGGAAKAVRYALEKMDINTAFVSRQTGYGLTYADLDQDTLQRHTVIVNATPVGLWPNVSECPALPYQWIGEGHLLFDCIYNPEETMFLQNGKQRGAHTVNGYQMLVYQAEEAWKIWMGNHQPENV